MVVNDINTVKPAKDNVVVRIVEPDNTNQLFFAKATKPDDKNAIISFGEVLAIGPTVLQNEHCPNLKKGDVTAFNVFAGSHIATNQQELYKIMGGYSIMATIDDIDNLNEETINPTANRLLLSVKFIDQSQDGLFIPTDEASDPRLEDLAYGTIIKVGPSCKLGYKIGDVVAYPPYAGEDIRHASSSDKPALRTLIEEDVLLTI